MWIVPAADLLQPGDHAQRGALAASRRTDEDEELALRDIEAKVVDRDDAAAELLAEVLDLDPASHRRSAFPGCGG